MKYVVLLLASFVSAHAANAAPMFFTDKALFDVAAGPQTTLDFEGEAPVNAAVLFTPSVTFGSVTFRSQTISQSVGIGGPLANITGSPFDSTVLFANSGTLLIADIAEGTPSFSANFGTLNTAAPNARITLSLSGGGTEQFSFNGPDLAPGEAGFFIGVTSDIPIVSVFYESSGGFEALDNFSIAAVQAVPVPAAGLLFPGALAGYAWVSRRKKRRVSL